MCLAIPGRVIRIYEENGLLMGEVDFGGVIKPACLAYVPDIQPDAYVLVHAGFALQRLDEAEVRTFHELWQDVMDAGRQKSLGEHPQ